MSERLLFELKAIDNATAPLRKVQNEIDKTANATRNLGGAMGSATKDTRKFAMGALQQAGYQVGDFAVQVANGTSKMQAFGQQAPQMLQIFGPIGAVVGAAVAIFAAFGVAVAKSGGQVSESAAMQIAAIEGLNDAIKETFTNINEMRFGGSAAEFAKSEIGKLKAEMSAIESSIVSYMAAIENARTGQALDSALIAKDIAEAELPALQDTLHTMEEKLKVLYANLRVQEGLSAAEEASRVQNMLKLQLIDQQIAASVRGNEFLNETIIKYTDINGLLKSASQIDLSTVFSNAISPSSALYQFVKKTFDTMVTMSKFQPQDYSGFMYGGQRADQRMAGASSPPKEPSVPSVPSGAGGGGTTDPLKTLREQLALEAELLGKSEAQRQVIQALGVDWKKYGAETVDGLTEQINRMDELNRVAEAQKEIAATIKSSMSDAFMSMVDGTKTVAGAFADMAKQIILKLYETLVVQQMVNAAMGLIGSVFPSLAPALSGVRAMGGQVTAGNSYLVGERGPEMIVPSRNANVVPNNKMGGGGVTVNQTINITTGVQQTVRAEIKSLMPQIADSAKAAVLDAKRRGGSYGSAFA